LRTAKVFTVILKARRCGLHTMVYVHRNHLAGPFFRAGDQECRGVGAAAKRYRQWQLGRKRLDGIVKRLLHGAQRRVPSPDGA
jgi:hypothetical protein